MADPTSDTNREILDVLKGYYDAFINIDNPKDFFYGLADYLEFLDKVPMLDEFSVELFAKRKPFEDRLKALEGPAYTRLQAIKDELAAYVAKHKIDNATIQQSLKEYDGWRTKKIVGSKGPRDGMHDVLCDVVEELFRMPEHREFAIKYIKFWEGNPDTVKHYLPVQEFDEYREAEQEYKNGMKNELWGQMGSIARQYQIVRHGEERRKKLVADYEKARSTELNLELMNHSILNGEWQQILEDRKTDRIYFFNVAEVRRTIVRYQNQLVASVLLRKYIDKPKDGTLGSAGFNDAAATVYKPRLSVQKDVGYLRLFDKDTKRRIAGTSTRQFRLVRRLFNPSADVAAPFAPTFQTEERIYEAIALPKDTKDTSFTNVATKEKRKHDIIEYTIKEIQGNKKIRQYLRFERNTGKMRLQITLPEGSGDTK